MLCVALHWEHRFSRAKLKHDCIYKEELPHINSPQAKAYFL